MISPTVFDQTAYNPSSQLLDGKIIAVTGAGSGIGRDAALCYAAHGATVVLLGRTIEKLEQVYDEIEAAGHPQAAIYPINFEGAVEKDYQDMCNSLDDAFGHLDGLLHNAAELGERTPIENYSIDTWQRILQVNVTAPFMMTKALSPLMQRAEAASVVFTGSSVGYKGRAYWGAYSVSKAATENLMQILADEFEEVTKVRCNSINPGATRTRMRAAAFPAENPATVKEAADLMPLYLYLMGPDSLQDNGIQFQG